MKRWLNLLLIVSICLGLSACGKNPQSQKETDTEMHTGAEVTAEMAKSPEDVGLRKKVINAAASNLEIISYTEKDFNGDGKIEAFAVIGEPENNRQDYEDSDERSVEYWFVSEEQCEKLNLGDDSWAAWYYELETETPRLTDSYYAWSVAHGPSMGGGHMTYYYFTVDQNGMPKPLLKTFDGKVQYNHIPSKYLQVTAQSMSGTRNYYEFDSGKVQLVEFGGLKITEEQFKKFDNGNQILKDIRDAGETVESILYRENKVVDINIKKEDYYVGRSYYIDGNKLQPLKNDFELTGWAEIFPTETLGNSENEGDHGFDYLIETRSPDQFVYDN